MQQALVRAPEPVRGLVAGREATFEELRPYRTGEDPKTLWNALHAWERKGLHLMAVYASSDRTAPPSRIRTSVLREICGSDAKLHARLAPLPLLYLRLDTQGRLEAELLETGPNDMHMLPLELSENGELNPQGFRD